MFGREFPKMRGTLFWGPYNKDPSISGTMLGSPISETPVCAWKHHVYLTGSRPRNPLDRLIWEFPEIRVHYFGVLIVRILLFRVRYWLIRSPIFGKFPFIP